MAEIALITKANIQTYEYISEQIQDVRLNAYILQAHQNDLRELLGNALYQDLFKKVTSISVIASPYAALVNGEEYEITSGEPIQYYGLKPFLCYATLCIILARNNFRVSDYGNVSFINDPQSYMDKVSKYDKETAMKSLHTCAMGFRNDIIKYLNEKYSTFPLWKGGNISPKNKQNYIASTLR